MSELESILSDRGTLAAAINHYRRRDGQIQLAQAIEEALGAPGALVAEAGTGVGKTFAYLVPVLRSQTKTLISTATRHLQDQLFYRDLPQVKAALGVSAQISLLKGRSNYLCLHRFDQQRESGRFLKPEDVQAMRFIDRFAQRTDTGDISECVEVPEGSFLWPLVTSTRENCLGQKCPQIKDCHLMAARKKAQDADVVVINHHLLCADLALREEGMGELLPSVQTLIIDEAHAISDIAIEFFGRSISSNMLALFARDCLAMGLSHARDAASWPDLCGAIERSSQELRLALGGKTGRLAWDAVTGELKESLAQKLQDALAALKACEEVLSLNSARSLELVQLHLRSEDLMARLLRFIGGSSEAKEDDTEDGLPSKDILLSAMVRWVEQTKNSVSFHLTPYDISDRFRAEVFDGARHWVFVSATLTVDGSFTHFQERLGLENARTLNVESPFEYQRQAMLVVPQELPDPKAQDLITQLLDNQDIQNLLQSAPGGIFILCTSLRAVEQAARWIRSFQENLPDTFSREILVQGESPRHTLLETFRRDGRAILIGSHSFWEGVDVPGSALSMVLIDKIPFAVPDDPVLEARSRALRAQGRDPFMEIQVPQAAILLKQGVGRLIRSEADRGLILIGDRRLAETAYGRKILRSLPGFARTRELKEALAWMTQSPELQA